MQKRTNPFATPIIKNEEEQPKIVQQKPIIEEEVYEEPIYEAPKTTTNTAPINNDPFDFQITSNVTPANVEVNETFSLYYQYYR